MRCSTSNIQLETIISRIKDGTLNLQPDFQRGEVWSLQKQKKLIDTILRRWTIPPIHIVPSDDVDEVLDGQQRLVAIRDFCNGKFAIDGTIKPSNNFIHSLDGLYYKDLEDKLGEHFILYIYYILETIKDNSILIIEEPESYISVLSQHRLVDYIAKIISEKKISVIMTTHSPHILKRISADHVRIISNRAGNTTIFIPQNIEEAKQHLGIEYHKSESNIATLFVEDNIARMFVSRLLKEECPLLENIVDVIYVGGHTKITARLSFDDSKYMSHRLVGIYDDDVKEKEDFKSEELKWPYLFLPVEDCVEKEIMNFLSEEHSETTLCSKLGIQCSTFAAVLSKREGEDLHDWFMDICNDLKIQYETFIKEFYVLWKGTHEEAISSFVADLSKSLFGDNEDKHLVEKQYAYNV